MNTLRAEAEELRRQGYSYNLIQERLGIAKGTMSYWFKEMPFTPNKEVLRRVKNGQGKLGIRRHNDRVNEIAKLKKVGIAEIGVLSARDLWLLGLGIYIGEGSKTNEQIRIVNSDPAVIRTSIKWLKESCGLDNENIRMSLHIYPDNNPEECIEYWQRVTRLKRENFRWISVDSRTNKSASNAGKLMYGTAHVTVISNGDKAKGVKLFRRLNGWIYGAMNQA